MTAIATHGSGIPDTATLNDILYMDTFWDDITGSLIGRQLASAAGKVGYDWDENTVVFSPSGNIAVVNDRINFNIQTSHATKMDSKLYLHIHWEQPDDEAYAFTVQYRIQANGKAKTSDWSTALVVPVATNSAFPYVSGTLNQITSLTPIDLTDAGLSCTVQFRLVRSDAVVGDIHATFIDAHFEKDSPGSREQYRK